MNGLNQVLIMGNLGADPELRMAAGGKAVLKLRVATNDRWQDKNGEWQERAEWHRVTVFGKHAENLAKFLRKGMCVTVSGQIRTSEIVAFAVHSPNEPPRSHAEGPGSEAPFAPASLNGSSFGRAPAAAATVDIPF